MIANDYHPNAVQQQVLIYTFAGEFLLSPHLSLNVSHKNMELGSSTPVLCLNDDGAHGSPD